MNRECTCDCHCGLSLCYTHSLRRCCVCCECDHQEHDQEYEHHHYDSDKGEPGVHCGNPNRPGKVTGIDRGRLNGPSELTPGDLTTDNPINSWAGPRKRLFLPFLFMRANPGDMGTRINADGSRTVDVFWESPDILIVAGVEPDAAPSIPPQLGQVALVGQPNTVYAHVWNFGLAQAPQVVVEFYWCDPSLGFNAVSAHLIGQSVITLGAKGSGHAHAVVKCPEPWTPTFLNGGHECLLVRVWDVTSDALGTPPWDASLNRHIGQRNIHVVAASGSNGTPGAMLPTPLILKVGPLFGAPAQVKVARIAPHEMPWLQLRSGVRGQFPRQALPTGTSALSRPGTVGGGTPTGGAATQQNIIGDDQQVAFMTNDTPPASGEAHVYRVTASQGGQTFGGYTVVVIGK